MLMTGLMPIFSAVIISDEMSCHLVRRMTAGLCQTQSVLGHLSYLPSQEDQDSTLSKSSLFLVIYPIFHLRRTRTPLCLFLVICPIICLRRTKISLCHSRVLLGHFAYLPSDSAFSNPFWPSQDSALSKHSLCFLAILS